MTHALLPPPKSPAWVLFDLGGVVIDLSPDQTLEAYQAHYLGDDELGWGQLHALIHPYETGNLSCEEYRAAIRELLRNSSLLDGQLDDMWNAMLGSIAAPRTELIAALKNQFQLAVLSNTNPVHIAEFSDRFRATSGVSFSDAFERIFLSHEVGLRKPGRAIFETVLKELEVEAESVLYLDDSIENLESAAQLGFSTWLIQHPDDWLKPLSQSLLA